MNRHIPIALLAVLLGCDEPTVKKPTPANLSCANGSLVRGVNAAGEPNCIAPADATTLALSNIAGVVSISSSTVAITTAANGDGLDLAMPSSDPFYAASTAASITSTDVSSWRALAAAGDHAAAGYFSDETDEVFAASPAAGITSLAAWNTASTWGNHAAGGYLLHEQDAFVGALAAGKSCRANASAELDCMADPPSTVLYKTVFVHPGETQTAGGQALLDALAQARNTATAEQPMLLRLEPGVYAVGSESVVGSRHVAIAGSGACCTTITGAGNLSSGSVVAIAGTGSRWRDLSIENVSSSNAIAMRVTGQDVVLANVTLRSSPRSRLVSSTAVQIDAGAFLHATDSLFEARGASIVTGISVTDAEFKLTRSSVDAQSSGSAVTAISCLNSTLSLRSSVLSATKATSTTTLSLSGCTGSGHNLTVDSSTRDLALGLALELIDARPFDVASSQLAGNVTLANSQVHLGASTVEGSLAADSQSNIIVASSRLLSPVSGDGTITLASTQVAGVHASRVQCVHSYAANFTSLASDCQ